VVRPVPVLRAGRTGTHERSMMRTIGIVTTVLGGLVLVVALVLGVRSLPDIQRYLRIRRM
jgi:hypothetical protein